MYIVGHKNKYAFKLTMSSHNFAFSLYPTVCLSLFVTVSVFQPNKTRKQV